MSSARKVSMDDLIQKLEDLPTLPMIVHELSQVISDPMSSTKEIEKIMASDQSMTVKVLKLVNSAYYAIPGGVSNLARAIAYLGYDTVYQLVLSTSIFNALGAKDTDEFNVKEFWKHSLGVAVAAETIGKRSRQAQTADLFTCGLVHDMGKIALLSLAPEHFSEAIKTAKKSGSSFHDAEVHLDSYRHTTIGGRLAQRWRLPTKMQAVIKYHHQKEANLRGGLSADMNTVVDIVFLANVLTHALKFGNSGHDKIAGAPVEIMERLTIHPQNDLKDLLLEIKQGFDRAEDFLKVLED